MRPAVAVLVFGLVSVFSVLSTVAQTTVAKVPTQEASDLNGRTLTVPGDLGGKPSLWLIAFGQDQQPQVDRMLALVLTVQKSVPSLQYWVVPVIEDPGSFVRTVIETGLKMSVSNSEARTRFVTLYVRNQDEWRRATGLASKSEAVLVAVSSDGSILASRPQSAIKDAAAVKTFIETLPKRP